MTLRGRSGYCSDEITTRDGVGCWFRPRARLTSKLSILNCVMMDDAVNGPWRGRSALLVVVMEVLQDLERGWGG